MMYIFAALSLIKIRPIGMLGFAFGAVTATVKIN